MTFVSHHFWHQSHVASRGHMFRMWFLGRYRRQREHALQAPTVLLFTPVASFLEFFFSRSVIFYYNILN